MIERALLTPDELKSLPKGTFIVMKTGVYPMQVKLKLFFKWGISFGDRTYEVADKGNRTVRYANKEELEQRIIIKHGEKFLREKIALQEKIKHKTRRDT